MATTMQVQRLMINICANQLQDTATFYKELFDFTDAFESDWYIQLTSANQQFELGIINRTNALVPEDYQTPPTGFYITLVVDNADTIHDAALAKQFTVVTPPEDTSYGQRRLLLKDPAGTLVDVSAPIPNFQFQG